MKKDFQNFQKFRNFLNWPQRTAFLLFILILSFGFFVFLLWPGERKFFPEEIKEEQKTGGWQILPQPSSPAPLIFNLLNESQRELNNRKLEEFKSACDSGESSEISRAIYELLAIETEGEQAYFGAREGLENVAARVEETPVEELKEKAARFIDQLYLESQIDFKYWESFQNWINPFLTEAEKEPIWGKIKQFLDSGGYDYSPKDIEKFLDELVMANAYYSKNKDLVLGSGKESYDSSEMAKSWAETFRSAGFYAETKLNSGGLAVRVVVKEDGQCVAYDINPTCAGCPSAIDEIGFIECPDKPPSDANCKDCGQDWRIKPQGKRYLEAEKNIRFFPEEWRKNPGRKNIPEERPGPDLTL